MANRSSEDFVAGVDDEKLMRNLILILMHYYPIARVDGFSFDTSEGIVPDTPQNF